MREHARYVGDACHEANFVPQQPLLRRELLVRQCVCDPTEPRLVAILAVLRVISGSRCSQESLWNPALPDSQTGAEQAAAGYGSLHRGPCYLRRSDAWIADIILKCLLRGHGLRPSGAAR